eukprot:CAMPEP_0119399634 /NCGR_PEP_ID=MMETSP1334-20130426/141459_1 /TAXON_ID=127549 /ORGANISM="Calcidiscus leptoporus, Strain RCC1130" /LENGTH=210 /DNA_ID=CAMNT_0007423531 /DNA_START=585 /DNA_END=1219 /DNA_ORIENTATION=-
MRAVLDAAEAPRVAARDAAVKMQILEALIYERPLLPQNKQVAPEGLPADGAQVRRCHVPHKAPVLGRPVANRTSAVTDWEGAHSLPSALAKAACEDMHHQVAQRGVGSADGRESQRVLPTGCERIPRREPVSVELAVYVLRGDPSHHVAVDRDANHSGRADAGDGEGQPQLLPLDATRGRNDESAREGRAVGDERRPWVERKHERRALCA